MKTSRYWLGAIALSLLQLSCGGSDSGSSPLATAGANGASGSSGASGTSGAGGSVAWDSITEHVSDCDQTSCSGGKGFTVFSDGHYIIGSSTITDNGTYVTGNSGQASGKITDAELAAVKSAASNAAAQNLSSMSTVCTTRQTTTGSSNYATALTYGDGFTYIINNLTASHSCYLGNQSTNDALHDIMHQLETAYDPVATSTTTTTTTTTGASGASGTSGASGNGA